MGKRVKQIVKPATLNDSESMMIIEIVLISATSVLAVLAYINYTRSKQILTETRTQLNEIKRLNNRADKRYQEALQVRARALKEGERIASFWYAERLN